MSDEQLVAVAQRGECLDEVYAILYRRLRPKLYGMILSMCGSEWDAEEVVQWAWVTACGRLHRYDPSLGASFSSWLCQVAVNHLRNLHRKQERGRSCLERMDALCPSSVRGPAEKFRRKRAQRRAQRCLCRLSREQRVAVKLRVMQGLHYREVARRMGCTVRHCRYLVTCGLQILRGQSGDLGTPVVA
jgi:RNA polymerase sigma-70 factor (ECF subfamily)